MEAYLIGKHSPFTALFPRSHSQKLWNQYKHPKHREKVAQGPQDAVRLALGKVEVNEPH